MPGGFLPWRRDRNEARPTADPVRIVAAGKRTRLREKRFEDAAFDYNWRCDAELASFDAVPPLTIGFEEYLRDYRYELAAIGPRRKRYAIETLDGRHIGNCSMFNIDDRRRQGELGIMIGDKAYWSRGYGEDIVRTLVGHTFRDLPVDRVYLYTLDWNVRAQRCFARSGFKECNRVADDRNKFVVMDLFRETFEKDANAYAP